MHPKKLINKVISNPDFPVVETKYGKLQGLWKDHCFIFRGIEYAKARRFHLPQEPDTWEGIKKAVVYGPVPDELSTRLPGDAFTVPHYWYPQSEFCQNLNIWTPSIDRDEKLPVMVWIHGGGQEHGSAIEIMAYDGEELANWGKVVIVSVNHRLNALGYLDLSAFGEEYKESGYAGMMDLVQSLKWIKENISGFGGDPDNVTLFGQSGGGFKIIELMQMPAADGLYHKVAISSGTGKDTLFYHENAGDVAKDIITYLGIDQKNIKDIEEIPFYILAKAVNHAYDKFKERTGERLQWTPPVDFKNYYGNPQMEGIKFREETNHIPMLLGSVLGEFVSTANSKNQNGDINTWDEARKERELEQRYGSYTKAIVEEFRKAYPDKNEIYSGFVDVFMRIPHIELCKQRAKKCAPVFNWVFSLLMPCYGNTVPWHNADEAYLFHHSEYIESQYIPEVSERLQDQMAGAWITFAYKGDPNHEALPKWIPIEGDTIHTMIFDEITVLRKNHDIELVKLISEAGVMGPGGKGPIRTYGGGPRAHR